MVKSLLPQDLTPQEPLTKARISESSGLTIPLYRKILEEYEEYRVRCTETAAQVDVSEKIPSISLILLRNTRSVLTAAQASIKESEALALAVESLITVVQDTAPHFPSNPRRTSNRISYGSQ